jgi:hypothetical protein
MIGVRKRRRPDHESATKGHHPSTGNSGRFNPDTYAFNRLPESEVKKAKQENKRGEAEGCLLRIWNGRPVDSATTAADASKRWEISSNGAKDRLRKLVSRGWLTEDKSGKGKATRWTLTPAGLAVVKPDTDDL